MARPTTNRFVRAVTDVMWQRDRRQMAAIDDLASAVRQRKRRTAVRARRRSAGFRSVLCPVDFSEHSRLALKYAAAIARTYRSELTVLFVNDPLLVAAAGVALNDRDVVRTSAIELQRFVDKSLPMRAKPKVRVTSRVAVGQPVGQILKAAERIGADLIVIGTHGLTGVKRAILGSTTQSVLRRTSVPVLVCPPHR